MALNEADVLGLRLEPSGAVRLPTQERCGLRAIKVPESTLEAATILVPDLDGGSALLSRCVVPRDAGHLTQNDPSCIPQRL
jgi:hypothetical protein